MIIPRYFNVMGAVGAALIAAKETKKKKLATRFKGFEALNVEFTPSAFTCNDCSNRCEIIEVKQAGNTIACWGDKCEKYGNNALYKHE